MPITMNHENTAQAYALIQRGTTPKELAEAWDISPSTVYGALARFKYKLREEADLPMLHVTMQIQSGVPPELYAARAGLAMNTLRKYSYDNKIKLAMNLHTEKKAWWQAKLDGFDPKKVQAFCIREDIPVRMLAFWFHRLGCPAQTLLWGFSELRVVDSDMFKDVTRFHNPHAGTHALGRGKSIADIDIRVATEAFKASSAY